MDGRLIVCRVLVSCESPTDAAELDALTRQLQREIAELPIEDVTRPEAATGASSEGGLRAKGWGMLEVGALLVTLNQARPLLLPLVELLKGWAARDGQRRVTLEIRGQKLELAGMSASETDRRIAEFRSATSGIELARE
jgi:hypothetical protein